MLGPERRSPSQVASIVLTGARRLRRRAFPRSGYLITPRAKRQFSCGCLGEGEENVRVDRLILALDLQAELRFDDGAVRELVVRLRADEDAPGGRETLQTRAGIDGVADEWIRDVVDGKRSNQ